MLPSAQAETLEEAGGAWSGMLCAGGRLRFEVRGYRYSAMGGNVVSGEVVLPDVGAPMNVNGSMEDTSVRPEPLGWDYTGAGVLRWQAGGQWCDDRCAYWSEPGGGGTSSAKLQISGTVSLGVPIG